MSFRDGPLVPNLNSTTITGNLTRDPDLFYAGDLAICHLRVAVNGRQWDDRKNKYVQKPNYFDVVVFGQQGENCAEFLSKGRPVAIEGRLDWREYYSEKYGHPMQAVQIVARVVQFLGTGTGNGGGRSGGRGRGRSGGQDAAPQTVIVDIENMPMEMFEGLADIVAERLEANQ